MAVTALPVPRRLLHAALAVVLAGVSVALVHATPSQAAPLPDVIQLPVGWQPEGIAAGRGPTMYSGSRTDGRILAVNVITGESRIVVAEPAGSPAVGLELDRFGRLWVAGGNTGQAFVYDAETGETVAVLQLAAEGEATFINDVVITRRAAWFTDSQQAVLHKVPIGRGGEIGDPVRVELTGDYSYSRHHVAGAFNLNGIDATPNDRWLIVVQSNTGFLYRVDPETGETRQIDLGGATVTNGDGILLRGRTLYVVRNRLNEVAVIDLDPRTFTSGELVGTITSPNFDVPTTMAAFGNRFYLVNARFGVADPLNQPYSMVAVRRR
ncbi:MAG: superoxide dismutase [Actinomycetota bacterium]|nr:superoxide dismutase [Actinomycetota bacterium]